MRHRRIGLTGGIGSGKSAVAGYLEKQGFAVIDADQVSKELLAPQMPGWQVIKDNFGILFIADDGTVDRRLLRQQIFSDSQLRNKMNSLLHPLVRHEIAVRIDKIVLDETKQESGTRNRNLDKTVIVEVPLLFEAGWEKDFDEIVVVAAGEEERLARLKRRDSLTRAEALQALGAQLALAEKIHRADHVINNDGEWEDTCRQLDILISHWRAG